MTILKSSEILELDGVHISFDKQVLVNVNGEDPETKIRVLLHCSITFINNSTSVLPLTKSHLVAMVTRSTYIHIPLYSDYIPNLF